MVLVERQVPTAESSVVLSATKAMGLIATLIGGIASDRFTTKTLVVLSFATCAVGMIGLSQAEHLFLIAACAMLAQFGTTLFQSPARLMLAVMAPGRQLPEALAWLRTAHNLGQVVSYGIGALFSGVGLAALMLYDAATSVLAVILGWRWLPSYSPHSPKREIRNLLQAEAVAAPSPLPPHHTSRPGYTFWITAGLLFGSSLLYELYISGAAGQYRELFGAAGLRVFSGGMVINTVLCALLAVAASRFFERPSRVLPLGLVLQAVGATVATLPNVAGYGHIMVGMFLLTLGEITFASISQATLMRLLPSGHRTGTYYGLAMTVQASGRIVGGALAFPWVVRGAHPALAFLGLAIPFVIAGIAFGPKLDAP